MNIYKGPKYSGPDTLTGGGCEHHPPGCYELHPLELSLSVSCLGAPFVLSDDTEPQQALYTACRQHCQIYRQHYN